MTRGFKHPPETGATRRKVQDIHERKGRGDLGCYDDAGNIIADCMDRMRQEESDWQHMRNQQQKPPTSMNGHSDEEYERGTNPPPIPDYHGSFRAPLETSGTGKNAAEYRDYQTWKRGYAGGDHYKDLFRGKSRSKGRYRDDNPDDGSITQ